jgi:uroporphyrinogen-III synthase
MPAQSLAGKRVLVTRAAHQAAKLSELLRELGAEPVEVPVLEIRPPESYDPLDAALRNLIDYDWLVFTSANTVHAFAERAHQQGIALSAAKLAQVAAIGSATAAAAEKIGLTVRLTPKAYVAESLAAALGPQISGERILLARAATARDVIPDALRAAGAHVDVVDAYRNVLPESAPQLLRAALATPIHAATFTSSSSVTHLAEAAHKAGIPFPLSNVPAISIGPITSQTLRESGWSPAAEASESDIAGLVAAVAQFLRC